MINPKCFKCEEKLNEFGAILLSPPKTQIESLNTDHIKQHLCVDCYWDVQKYISESKNPPIPKHIQAAKEYAKKIMPKAEIEKYTPTGVIYWFSDKKSLFKWVDWVAELDADRGTIEQPRFGGNYIDVEPEAFKKFINWVFIDCKRVGLGGYGEDLTVEEIFLDPKPHALTKELRRRAHVARADEVGDVVINGNTLVRCWWD